MTDMQYRAQELCTKNLCVKTLSDEGQFSGYASVFNVADNDRDVVLRGAFAESLQARPQVKLLWQHVVSEPIGRLAEIKEDARGLYVQGQLAMETQKGSEAYHLLKSGAIDGLSIGYRVKEYSMDGQTGLRLLHVLELLEVSLVTFPANEDAVVTHIKGHAAIPCDIRAFEGFLREAGYSRKKARDIALHGFPRSGEVEAHDIKSSGQADQLAFDAALDRAFAVLAV